MTWPLNDPNYEPKHPPVNGSVPWVIGCWGPRSQLRWFNRFRRQLKPRVSPVYTDLHIESVEHTGNCCYRCGGYDDPAEFWDGPGCCCKARKEWPR